MYKIMIVEDDENLRNQVGEILTSYGYEVYKVTNFKQVLEDVDAEKPQLIILDINLPFFDGNYYCRAIRNKYKVPIIITSARNGESDQILGMELGGDDYVVKPFNINILLTRISACLRRTYGEYAKPEDNKKRAKEYGKVHLDDAGMKLIYCEKVTDLSKNEYKLMKCFIEEPDTVIEREKLLSALWDDKTFVDDNTLTVNITRLKKKFEDMGLKDIIHTKRGVGYIYHEVNREEL